MSDSFDLFLDKVGVDDKFWQFWPFCFIEKDNLDDKFREREREREREKDVANVEERKKKKLG
jgi:hypothetical protein